MLRSQYQHILQVETCEALRFDSIQIRIVSNRWFDSRFAGLYLQAPCTLISTSFKNMIFVFWHFTYIFRSNKLDDLGSYDLGSYNQQSTDSDKLWKPTKQRKSGLLNFLHFSIIIHRLVSLLNLVYSAGFSLTALHQLVSLDFDIWPLDFCLRLTYSPTS